MKLLSYPFLIAMGAPPAGGAPAWVQFVPFALVLGIFYFVILMPMKRKQQKVDAFLSALKVGDRVVTSGHGGVFPPGLPVGTIGGGTDDVIRVQPFVDLGRLEHMRIVDYGMQGLLPAPVPAPASSGGGRRGQR